MLSQNPQAMQQSSSANGASTQEQQLRAQLELLQNHDPESSSGPAASTARDPRSASSRLPNGYDALASSTQDVPRPAPGKLEPEAHIHPDLRGASGHAPTPTMMPMAPPAGHSPGPIAPAGPSVAPLAPAPPSISSQVDDLLDGRKAKRELSQSKRAAQNRAAQRAFRQRKEGYIKKLEQQVRELADLDHSYKSMQSENYALREYVLHLQSRLMESQIDVPPPPPNINLSQPAAAPAPTAATPEQAPTNPGVGTPLEAVAQAVAGLAAHDQMAERQQPYASAPFKQELRSEEDTRTAEEINRHLHSEEGPAPA